MSELKYTSAQPTEPGWYFVEYTGAKSKARRTDVLLLATPDPTGWIAREGDALCIRDHSQRSVYGPYVEFDLSFDESCYPVYFAGPIPAPHRPDEEAAP